MVTFIHKNVGNFPIERTAEKWKIPTAPMVSDTKTRILQRALEIVGNHEDLARKLRVRPLQLATWLGGIAAVPDEVFLNAVDIVLHHETQDVSLWNHEAPRPPKPH